MRKLYFTIAIISMAFSQLLAQCDFQISEQIVCGQSVVNFDVDGNGSVYSWDFDEDQIIDTYGNNVSHLFPASNSNQTYTVNLYQNDLWCGSDTLYVLASPDASIGVIPGSGIQDGNTINICNSTSSAVLSIFNASTTLATNVSYVIDWGDNSSQSFSSSEFTGSSVIEHTYSGFGFYNIQVTATGVNACTGTQDYLFYNGANPSVGLATPGNTVGLCAPANVVFPITNTDNNPVGTVYNIYISGELVESYTQANVPENFNYTFENSSCGLSTSTGNYTNAFDVQIEAVNPCGSSQATIEPIEISEPPELEFEVGTNGVACSGEVVSITNISEASEVINGDCFTNLTPSWTIEPNAEGINWNVLSGNMLSADILDVEFLIPGTYTIRMTVNSPGCGSYDYEETITIIEGVDFSVSTTLESGNTPSTLDNCVPAIANFDNTTIASEAVVYQWSVWPQEGWSYENNTSINSEDLSVSFEQAGTYNIFLSINSSCAVINWDTSLVIAGSPILTLPELTFCESAVLNFDPSTAGMDANGGELISFQWAFPGGVPETSSEQYPTNIVYDTPGEYLVSLTTTNECGQSTANTTVHILSSGSLDLPNDMVICASSDPITLEAVPTGGVWIGSGVSADGIFTASEELFGENPITYLYNNGGCNIADSLIITVATNPIAIAGEDKTVCANQPPFFLNPSPSGGTWSSNNNGVILNNEVFDPGSSGPGVYNLNYVFGDPSSGCSDSDSLTVIVVEEPFVEAGIDLSFCNGTQDIQLSGATPSGGIWSGPGITNTGLFNPSNTNGPGFYTIYYSYTDEFSSCTSIDSIHITVEPFIVDAGDQIELCLEDELYFLEANTPEGGSWEGDGIYTNTNIFDPEVAGPGVHILTYTVEDANCSAADELVIIVHDVVPIEMPADMQVCEMENPVLLSALPAGGTWNGFGVDGEYFNPTEVGEGIYSMTYTFQDVENNCLNSDKFFIEVLPAPTLEIEGATYCNQAIVDDLPFAFPSGGFWEGPGVIGDLFDATLAGGEGVYTLSYSYTNAASCSNTTTVEIEIIAAEMAEAGAPDTLCAHEGNLILEGNFPQNGIWSGVGIIDSLQGIFDPLEAGEGNHELTYTIGEGSCLVNDVKPVFVVVVPELNAGPDLTLCINDSLINLGGTYPENSSWSGIGIVDATQGIFDPSTSGVGSFTITLSYTDPVAGCTLMDEKIVDIFPLTNPDFNAPEIVCRNQVFPIENLTETGLSYFWEFGDGSTSDEFSPEYAYTSVGEYTITLHVENEHGCVETISKIINVTDIPLAYFVPEANDACFGLELEVENQSTGYGLEYLWSYGNGQTSMEENPSIVFEGSGINDTTYIVTLTVSNLCGEHFHQDVIQVHPVPNASIGLSPDSDCSPVVVSFANATIGNADDFYWDFGNGNTSTEDIPDPQTYVAEDAVTSFEVTMIASNVCSSDTAIQEIQVIPPAVQAIFTASPDYGCAPLEVVLQSQATPGANIDWEFGDGNSSNEENPVHVFEEAGSYTIIQFASTECGYDTMTREVTVLPAPTVFFEHEATVCLFEEISFTNLSENVSGNNWDFGDGNFSTLNNPVHIYAEPGIYTVTLTGESLFNQCPAVYTSEVVVLGLPSAGFIPSALSGCVPFDVTFEDASTGGSFYEWDFGDGNTAVGTTVSHVFEEVGSYDVTMVATDENGCFKDTTILNIDVFPTPASAFEFDPEDLCQLPTVVNFENQSQRATGYEWTFGDGYNSTNNNPDHAFGLAGDYDIQLIVANQYECKDTLIKPITIYPSPIAEFDLEDYDGCSPVQVVFDNQSMSSNSYSWDFGDGYTSTEPEPTHTYVEAGLYDVKLKVGIDNQCFDSIEISSLIEVFPTPIAAFEYEEVLEGGVHSGTFQFINRSEFADSYWWEFSDGFVTEEANPLHRFENNGIQTVLLEAESAEGCRADTLMNIEPDLIKGLFLPNGFSPGHGIGDVQVFKPAGIGLKEFHLRVYSPYGQLLWESSELQEGIPTEFWDGTFNGQLQPQDVYVWKCSGIFVDGTIWKGVPTENGGFKTMGSVILLR